MTKHLELQLVAKYPQIFKEYGGDRRQTCMAWGMSHGDGWYKILDELCEKLTAIEEKTGVQTVAAQIKEKFGTLSFYHQIENGQGQRVWWEIISDLISKAKGISGRTCELTGQNGKLMVRGGYYQTLSEEKAKELGFITLAESKKQFDIRQTEITGF